MPTPPMVKVDAIVVRVPSVEDGLAFYRDGLGHALIWRSDDAAIRTFVGAGGTVVADPADIPIGRVAVVRDPFGNQLVLLDASRGHFVTDESGQVVGLTASESTGGEPES